MGNWTVATTVAEDEAINYAYAQSQKTQVAPGLPPPPALTVQQFFDQMTHASTIAPMVTQYQHAQNDELVATFATIPPENRPAARTDMDAVIVEHGGTVPMTHANYLWSASTAPPPRNNSVEVNATDANFAQVTKIYFHYLDADGVNRMASLMAVPLRSVIQLHDPANSANFLQVVTTGSPIQRQGANGHVEIAVSFSQRGGSFAALDTHPLACSFS